MLTGQTVKSITVKSPGCDFWKSSTILLVFTANAMGHEQVNEQIKKPMTDADAIDALLSVGGYLKSKGLRKLELTIENNARLRIEIDIDFAAEMSDRFRDAFRQ
ncbi:MAG: hypothetical protein AAGG51_29955 [Cyanobacteria bacterium P01_G01_bin.54]